MLFNFCDPRLRPEIQCSTVSSEGHEITNLITDSSKGFLAYSCIKPPVNIDITFLCNICINHIIIWPYVGSQKSSGFQLYGRTSTDQNMPYSLLSTGYLESSDAGLLFHPANIKQETISSPSNFLKRYIKQSMQYLTRYTNSIRICICKTENSVPALGRIEVWGTVAPRCGKDTVASIHTLWYKQPTSSAIPIAEVKQEHSPSANKNNTNASESSLEIPECFLDAITCEIMTQPIMLPSGKVIDQTTLQKHEESEAVWGRILTDPFTGISFNEHRKPVVATALKMRIDKFLLDNSDAKEIKKLPRVLGRAVHLTENDKRALNPPICTLKENTLNKSSSDAQVKSTNSTASVQKTKQHCHNLPMIVTCPKRAVTDIARPIKRARIANSIKPISATPPCEQTDKSSAETIDVNVESCSDIDITMLVPNLKRFNDRTEKDKNCSTTNKCNCCPDATLYQLPCSHVICRKVLTCIKNNQCTVCDMSYKTSDVKRIFQ